MQVEVISPDGATLWVSRSDTGVVKTYGRLSRTALRAFATGGKPRRIAVTPATNLAVVANEDSWVDFLK